MKFQMVMCALVVTGTTLLFAQQHEKGAATQPELVAAYDALADTILGAKKTEMNLVRAMLIVTYDHAQATLNQAKAKISGGQDARQELERLAALVSQLGNEGDAAVTGVRKRLLEGGHHHNARAEQLGLYDEGFVIVTRAAKKVFLEAATEIGRLARKPNLSSLEGHWKKVGAQYHELIAGSD